MRIKSCWDSEHVRQYFKTKQKRKNKKNEWFSMKEYIELTKNQAKYTVSTLGHANCRFVMRSIWAQFTLWPARPRSMLLMIHIELKLKPNRTVSFLSLQSEQLLFLSIFGVVNLEKIKINLSSTYTHAMWYLQYPCVHLVVVLKLRF